MHKTKDIKINIVVMREKKKKGRIDFTTHRITIVNNYKLIRKIQTMHYKGIIHLRLTRTFHLTAKMRYNPSSLSMD
jgi:hypothetical protein